jgi:hypothetical protein
MKIIRVYNLDDFRMGTWKMSKGLENDDSEKDFG